MDEATFQSLWSAPPLSNACRWLYYSAVLGKANFIIPIACFCHKEVHSVLNREQMNVKTGLKNNTSKNKRSE